MNKEFSYPYSSTYIKVGDTICLETIEIYSYAKYSKMRL